MFTIDQYTLFVIECTIYYLKERFEVDYQVWSFTIRMMRRPGWWRVKFWSAGVHAWVEWHRLKYERDPFLWMKWIAIAFIAVVTATNPSGVWASVVGYVTRDMMKLGVVVLLLTNTAVTAPWLWRFRKSYLSSYITPLRRTWGKMDFLSMIFNTVVRLMNAYAFFTAIRLVSQGMDPRFGVVVDEALYTLWVLIFLCGELYVVIPAYHYLEDLDSEAVRQKLDDYKWKLIALAFNIFIVVTGYAWIYIRTLKPVVTEHIVVESYVTVSRPWEVTAFYALLGIACITVLWWIRKPVMNAVSAGFNALRDCFIDPAGDYLAEVAKEPTRLDRFFWYVWRTWCQVPTITAFLFVVLVYTGWQDVIAAGAAGVSEIGEREIVTVSSSAPVASAPASTITATITPVIARTATMTQTVTPVQPTQTLTAVPVLDLSDIVTWVSPNIQSGTNVSSPYSVVFVKDGQLYAITEASSNRVLQGETMNVSDMSPINAVAQGTQCHVTVVGAGTHDMDICYVYPIDGPYFTIPRNVNDQVLLIVRQDDNGKIYFLP